MQNSGSHHAHGHGGHAERAVLHALSITLVVMIIELVGGYMAGSLALLADAAHMGSDVAALALAWLGFRFGRRPADERRSYGYRRLEVLAAFVNGIIMIGIAGAIALEAAQRLFDPRPVEAGLMAAVAAVGLAANVAAYVMLRRGGGSLNLRAAMAHVLGDLAGSLAALAAAGIILLWGWVPADPLLSLIVAGVIVNSALGLVRDSGHILLEGTPETIDVPRLKSELARLVPEIADVHHVHAWTLAGEHPLLTMHVRLRTPDEDSRVLRRVKAILTEEFGITHSVIQAETTPCPDREQPQ